MFTNELRRKSAKIIDSCKAKGVKVTTAESCTGGLLSGLITETPGSSAAFECGYVTYANRAKTELLKVDDALIKEYGAVSEPVAAAMAQGALAAAKADIALAITGVAGPETSEKKPVGLVFIAVAAKDYLHVVKHNFSGERSDIRLQSVERALDLLEEALNRSFVSVA